MLNQFDENFTFQLEDRAISLWTLDTPQNQTGSTNNIIIHSTLIQVKLLEVFSSYHFLVNKDYAKICNSIFLR